VEVEERRTERIEKELDVWGGVEVEVGCAH
jgi:hypothetical protein